MFRLLAALGVAAFLTVAVASTGRAPDTYPVADTALTSIYTLRAARGELAVGSYSRFGWNHPGPLLYQALALPYAASGRREIALKWTALAINLAWLGGAIAVAGRRSPRLAVALAVALVPLLWREQRLLFVPWNPFAPVLALACAIALAADLGGRGRWTLALLVLALSFCVQAHVGLAIAGVAILVAAGATWWWWRAPIADRLAGPRASASRLGVALAIGVAALVWAAPFVHELRQRPGNVAPTIRFLMDPAHTHPSWPRAVAASGYMLWGSIAPSWQVLEGEVPAPLPPWTSPLFVLSVALVGGSAVVSARRGDTYDARFAAIAAGATLSAPIAAHGIVGPMNDYLLLWVTGLGGLDAAVILSTAWRLLRLPTVAPRVVGALLVAVLAGWSLIGGARLTGKHAEQAQDTTMRALSMDLRAYCRAHGIARPVVHYAPDAWQELAGLVLQFSKADAPIAVSDAGLSLVGPPFARAGNEDGTFYLMPADGAALPAAYAGQTEWVTTRGGYRVVRVR